MKLINLNCPNCGGKTEFDNSKEFGFCHSCGTKILIQEEVKKFELSNLTNTENLLILIKQAPTQKEAYQLCNDFLKLDPNNLEVLTYKSNNTSNMDESFNLLQLVLIKLNDFPSSSFSFEKLVPLFKKNKKLKYLSSEEFDIMQKLFLNIISLEDWENFILFFNSDFIHYFPENNVKRIENNLLTLNNLLIQMKKNIDDVLMCNSYSERILKLDPHNFYATAVHSNPLIFEKFLNSDKLDKKIKLELEIFRDRSDIAHRYSMASIMLFLVTLFYQFFFNYLYFDSFLIFFFLGVFLLLTYISNFYHSKRHKIIKEIVLNGID